ncbi:MAG: 1-acyl-sn-glycerol-3-phosphate acyltransferase [Anaerolineales bacterium]|nr:1-acyl-sn-glycerol-3-phosphate acyltransferase [Anaerolineales bacterium]
MSEEHPDILPDPSWKAVKQVARLEDVQDYLINEIFKALGLRADSRIRAWLGPVFTPLVASFARKAAAFDASVAHLGLQQAAQEWLRKWIAGLHVVGSEHLPAQGSLLIAANHPGTVDGLAIASLVQRPDLKIVVAGNPFFRMLPNLRQYFIYATRDPQVRLTTLLNAVRHLRSGGALLIFPNGMIDPDPLHYESLARQALTRWSESVKLMLSKVPHANLVLAINSGFVAADYLRNPVVRLRPNEAERQKLAEFLQVIHQVVFNQQVASQPSIAFSEPVPSASLITAGVDIQEQITAAATRLMDRLSAA